MNYITKKGFHRLKAESQRLLYEERPKLVQVISWAASNGDRSENGDYIYGKKRLREIDRRLRYLKQKLEDAEIIDPESIKNQKIVFSASVEVMDQNGKIKNYMIVGEDEIAAEKGLISWRSPIARALIGKEVGDLVEVKLPKEIQELEICSIEYKNYD